VRRIIASSGLAAEILLLSGVKRKQKVTELIQVIREGRLITYEEEPS
jgi:hypothetical protein